MRWAEIICEDSPRITPATASLISTLSLLQAEAELSDAPPKINTQSLINMMQKYGSFTYDSLVAANENPQVSNLIKSFNQNEVILNTSSNSEVQGGDNKSQDPQKVVAAMAKRQLPK